jgi:sugar (pentulose or hexulose) kinase
MDIVLFLSVDFGTSSVKMSIVDETLRELQTARATYRYLLLPGSKVEINPDELWKAFYEAASDLDPQLRSKVEMLCYDAFSPSPVFIQESGALAYPNVITHLDRRSREQCAYIDRHFGRDRYLHIAGIYPFAGGAGVMTLLWLKQNQPECLECTYRIGHLTTYLHKRLTGEWMVDLVNASMLGLYETVTQSGWSRTLLEAFGLDEKWFGLIYAPGTILGELLPEIAGFVGLRSGIPVAVGTNDMAAAQVGAGNEEVGCIMNTAGSSDMVSILTDAPVVNPHYYLRNSALPGMWQIYATTAGGFALDWFHEQFARDFSTEEFYGEFVPRALRDFKDDGEVTFDPYLTGDRQSMEVRSGAWHGLTLAATREEMLAALLKSMNRVLNMTIREAGEVVKLRRVVKLTGGMTADAFVRLKEREMPGFKFEVVDNCTIKGNVALVRRYL